MPTKLQKKHGKRRQLQKKTRKTRQLTKNTKNTASVFSWFSTVPSNHVVRCTEVNSLATGFNLEAYLASVLELDTTTMALTFIK